MAAAATPASRLAAVRAKNEAERVRNSRREEVNMVRSLPVRGALMYEF
jgi:hypothetical protein